MSPRIRVCCLVTAAAQLLVLLQSSTVRAAEAPATVVDSDAIIRSLTPSPTVHTRGLQIESRAAADADTGNSRISLDIRFGNNSDHLTPASTGQLDALGSALASAELARARFLIAGHTSASGTAEHNRRLSGARARAVRAYLIEHFHLAQERIAATGYGSSRPLPNFAPNALQQRRVEVIRLAPSGADRNSR